MSKTFMMAFGIGLVCIAIAVAGIVYMQRGAKVDAEGKILKVRTLPLDENSSLAVLDFRIVNASDYPFMVRTVTVVMDQPSGDPMEGDTVSEPDAKRVFASVPALGQKYNDTLIMNDRMAPHASWDRMVAARFSVPEDRLQARKRFIVRVEEVDGKVVDINEK